MKYYISLLWFLISIPCLAQNNIVGLSTEKLKEQGFYSIERDSAWQFKKGKLSPKQLKDEEGWEHKIPAQVVDELLNANEQTEVWLRISIKLDDSFTDSLFLHLRQRHIAFDVFIDGKLAKSAGNTGYNQEPYLRGKGTIRIPISTQKQQVIAIRYVHKPLHSLIAYLAKGSSFPDIRIETVDAIESRHQRNASEYVITDSLVSLFFLLFLLFFILYFVNPEEHVLRYITLFNFFLFWVFGKSALDRLTSLSFEFEIIISAFDSIFFFYSSLVLMVVFAYIFKNRPPKNLWVYIVIYTIVGALPLNQLKEIIILSFTFYPLGACVYYMFSARKQLQKSQRSIVIGVLIFIIGLIVQYIINRFIEYDNTNYLIGFVALISRLAFALSIPLSFVVYIAIRLKETSDNVKKKVEENKQILENQNKILEERVEQRTIALKESNQQIKQAFEELSISNQKFQSIMDSRTVGIALADLQFNVTYSNDLLNDYFRYTQEEMIGMNYLELIAPHHREEVMEGFKTISQGEVIFEVTREYIRKDKTKFWGHFSANLIKDENNEPLHIIGILTDIDKLKTQEIEIQHKNKEIQIVNGTLQTTLNTVEHQKNEILSSINYAKRIQNSILPTKEQFEKLLPDSFVFFQPRDIVSGDFYFIREIKGKIILAAIDCTGHGVPGAFMSFIGHLGLTSLTTIAQITSASELLKQLNIGIRFTLQQERTKTNDGMDMALVVIDKENKTLEFSGAKNPLIYLQNNELTVIKGDKTPIGGEQKEDERLFTTHRIDISQPTTFYLFSDGYQDQFGGDQNRKFMIKRFRELLLEIHQKPMQEQKEILNQTIQDWMKKADEKQIDDILVVGCRV